MLKRILAGLGAVMLAAALVLPAMAIESSADRRARIRNEAQNLPSQAEAAMNAKDFDKAIELYTKAIESKAFNDQPQTMGNLFFARGIAYRQKENCNAAIADFTKALETISKGDVHFGLAACHLTLKQEDLALKDLDNAVKVDPEAVSYRSARCKLLFNRKDFAAALPDCEKALAAIATDKDLMMVTALTAEQTGNRTRAAEVFRRLLAADPGNTIAAEGLKRTGG